MMEIREEEDAPIATATSDGGEWDCPLCLKLLYEPTTADCGHSFCRRCAFDLVSKTSSSSPSLLLNPHSNCPICRASLPKWSLSPSIALERLLRHSFPSEYSNREAEEGESALPRRLARGGGKTLPLFVLDPMLPGQQMFLHVFEIRYRVLIQRALADHDRRFGMMGVSTMDTTTSTNNGVANFGTEVEITNCRELPDGRFHVEILGKTAFRVVEKSMRDGYWEATVEPLDRIAAASNSEPAAEGEQQEPTANTNHNDDDDDDDTNNATNNSNDDDNDLDELVQAVERNYDEWEECVRTNFWERHGSQMDDVKRRLGNRPTDAGDLALWVAAAINPLPPLGVASEIRLAVLGADNHRERLVIVRDALEDSLKLVSTKRGTIRVCGITIYVQTLFLGVFVPVMCLIVQAHTRRVLIATGWDAALMRLYDASWEGGEVEEL
jgi:Lon protease-like protein